MSNKIEPGQKDGPITIVEWLLFRVKSPAETAVIIIIVLALLGFAGSLDRASGL